MKKSPLDQLVEMQGKERFPPPLTAFDWGCHFACWLLLLFGAFNIISNLSAFRAAQPVATGSQSAPQSVLWILYGSAAFTYVLFAALTPFPKLYNYPFRLKPGEERVVFPPTRKFANLIAVQSVLMLILINWDIIRTVAHGKASVLGWLMVVLLCVMFGTIAFLLFRITRLHLRYEPAADAEASRHGDFSPHSTHDTPTHD